MLPESPARSPRGFQIVHTLLALLELSPRSCEVSQRSPRRDPQTRKPSRQRGTAALDHVRDPAGLAATGCWANGQRAIAHRTSSSWPCRIRKVSPVTKSQRRTVPSSRECRNLLCARTHAEKQGYIVRLRSALGSPCGLSLLVMSASAGRLLASSSRSSSCCALFTLLLLGDEASGNHRHRGDYYHRL